MRRVGVPTILPTGEVVSRRALKRSKKRVSNLAPDFYSMKPITAKKAEEEETKVTGEAAKESGSDEEKLTLRHKDCESETSKTSDDAPKKKVTKDEPTEHQAYRLNKFWLVSESLPRRCLLLILYVL